MTRPDPPASPLRLAIDEDALAANWRALQSLSATARAGAAVKADGYGLGAVRVVRALQDAGCTEFFVAHWSEAADIVAHVPPGNVAVLHGPMNSADAAYAQALGLRPVINSLTQARLWVESGGGICDLMVDTGINRLGVPLAEIGDPLIAALEIDVMHSHLACADEDSPLNPVQLRRWQQARDQVPHRRAALANSAGIVLGSAYHGDLTRPGLALYGGVPRVELDGVIRQVARPMAAIMQVRSIETGDSIGYNATFTAERPMRTGTIALGYADGYLRCWSGGAGHMIHQGRMLPVIGRVSMDMTVIDLSVAHDLAEGDWVEVPYDLPSAARLSGLSQYELLTLLDTRFAR